MIERILEPDGLIVTRCSGRVGAEDSLSSLAELGQLAKARGALFELVLNDPDLHLDVDFVDGERLSQAAHSLFQAVETGAIAFVGEHDLIYGMCRQMQSLCGGTKVAVEVFRTEPEARSWLSSHRG